jgi:hypothetical protein
MALPAIVAALAIDPILDGTDLVIDLGDFAVSTYTAYVTSYSWLTALLNLFYDIISDYKQNSKLDRLLECNVDAKKFNRLLGDALNYAVTDPALKTAKRNDQEYIDTNETTGLPCLDWDGGLPALINHRHYDLGSLFERVTGYDGTEPVTIFLTNHLDANWFCKDNTLEV